MIKNFSLVLAMVLVLGLGFAMADSQVVTGDVSGFAEFDLVTTTVNYGNIIPGQTSNVFAKKLIFTGSAK